MPRARCNVCHNAVASCICKWISPIFNKTTVVILQHPDEAKKPLGTAKIVSSSLQNSKIKIGVDFPADEDLNQLTNSPNHSLAILYPTDLAIDLQDWRHERVSSLTEETSFTAQKTLIVLDGTWRNTREIMNVNPALKTIRSVKLTPATRSNYRIRKAPFANSLSTVEAVSQALNVLEPETSVEAMNLCFQNMIDYQISRMGRDVYRNNYLQSPDQRY